MFHKADLDRFPYHDNDLDDDIDSINNPVGPIIAAIQKQQAKKTATLPKNNISGPMGVMVHNFIKLAGVQANPAKRIVALLANKPKYDPKSLSNMTELLQTNHMEAVALMFEATFDCYQRAAKSDKQRNDLLPILENTFKDIAYNILKATLKVQIKSIAQEFHAAFCDVDLDPYNADTNIRERLDILK